MSIEAAKYVADAIKAKPDIVLGLPTGGTPVGMYKELVRLHKEEGLD
ncbi:MAG TPA: glucosamine-6-phosphate deaminase, partial [Bacillota bacterium]|nr:glucosamine-6-phosphate deaminase [Bacillota bacterium]